VTSADPVRPERSQPGVCWWPAWPVGPGGTASGGPVRRVWPVSAVGIVGVSGACQLTADRGDRPSAAATARIDAPAARGSAICSRSARQRKRGCSSASSGGGTGCWVVTPRVSEIRRPSGRRRLLLIVRMPLSQSCAVRGCTSTTQLVVRGPARMSGAVPVGPQPRRSTPGVAGVAIQSQLGGRDSDTAGAVKRGEEARPCLRR
jgi:hypothetical protein